MPIYEYRCRQCGETFETLRAPEEADAPTACGSGHTDVVRALSLVAPRSRGETRAPGGGDGGGACCAAGCACGRG